MLEDSSQRSGSTLGFAIIDALPLTALALMVFVSVIGAEWFGFTYAGGPVTVVLILTTGLWIAGRTARAKGTGDTLVPRLAECMGLILALSLMASITSAVLAASNAPMIDHDLAAADEMLFPWVSWAEAIEVLKQSPWLQKAMSHIYVSINWQPFLLLAAGLLSKDTKTVQKFVAAWAISVTACVLPLYWLPADGPYAYYNVGNGPTFGQLVDFQEWNSLLHSIRQSDIRIISKETITGLVTIPSFHACSAILFGWAFSKWKILKPVMITLNLLMIISAVPIGGHYFIDIVTGAFIAVIVISAIELLARLQSTNFAIKPPLANAYTV